MYKIKVTKDLKQEFAECIIRLRDKNFNNFFYSTVEGIPVVLKTELMTENHFHRQDNPLDLHLP